MEMKINTTTAFGAPDAPEMSEYACYLFGTTKGYGLMYRPKKIDTPNWFWRKMQFICFGNRWVKE